MNTLEQILIFMGALFIAIGGLVSTIFVVAFGEFDVFILIPFLFVIIGACFVGGVVTVRAKKKRIITKGKKYSAKIYGYEKNFSMTVNDQYPYDTKVHYFDENGIEREALIPTGITGGSSKYPIGFTIDIYELNGKYNYDPKSVRDEILPGEKELMDDKPVDPEKLKVIAVSCPSCGASFEAAEGYSNKCPYCGGFINA